MEGGDNNNDNIIQEIRTVKNIKKNEKITTENTWVKRPGNGKIKAFDYHKILGLKLKRDVKINEQIEWKDLNK